MLANAHIRSMGAALMRALGDEDPVPGDTLKISSDSESSHPRMSGDLDSHALFRMEGQLGKSEPMSKPIEPAMVGLHIEQLSKRLRR